MESVVIFKAKRAMESFVDFFKELFYDVNKFMGRAINHHGTQKTIRGFSFTKRKMVFNFRNNNKNWKNRIVDQHGFKIEDEDA